MKKKKFLIISFLIVIILIFPIKMVFKDGGTKSYNAILYRVIKWNKLSSGGKMGTDVYFFPNNFKSLDDYYVSSNDYLNLYKKTIVSIMQTVRSINEGIEFIAVEMNTFKYLSDDDRTKLFDFIKEYHENLIDSAFDNLDDALESTKYGIADGMFMCANNIKLKKKSVQMEVFKYKKNVGTLSIIYDATLVDGKWLINETMVG